MLHEMINTVQSKQDHGWHTKTAGCWKLSIVGISLFSLLEIVWYGYSWGQTNGYDFCSLEES